MNLHSIESKDNQVIKHIVKLSQNKRYREESHQAVVYGEHLVIEALKHNMINKIFVHDNALAKYLNLDIEESIEVYAISEELVKKVNVLDSTCDILAIINLPEEHELDSNQDSILLENIQDPGNLGAILRAAKASGISQVVLSTGSVDIYNPKVLRASQGIQFGLNIINNCDLTEIIGKLNTQIFALTPHTEISIYSQDLTKPTAFLLGNEGNGLTEEILSHIPIDKQITIPMHGDAESINLAMATTVAVFELSRQRSIK